MQNLKFCIEENNFIHSIQPVPAAAGLVVDQQLAHPAVAERAGGVERPRGDRQDEPGLKGSIGEGPNHSNYSDQSSVRILGIERKPRKTTSSKWHATRLESVSYTHLTLPTIYSV